MGADVTDFGPAFRVLSGFTPRPLVSLTPSRPGLFRAMWAAIMCLISREERVRAEKEFYIVRP